MGLLVYFCDKCGFVSDPNVGMQNKCPCCQVGSLLYLDGSLSEIVDRVSDVRIKNKSKSHSQIPDSCSRSEYHDGKTSKLFSGQCQHGVPLGMWCVDCKGQMPKQ